MGLIQMVHGNNQLSPHGIVQKTDVHEGKLIKSFEGEMEMGLVNGH